MTWNKTDCDRSSEPGLGSYESYVKIFTNPHKASHARTPVTIRGPFVSRPFVGPPFEIPYWSFSVNDGPNGDFSYSGTCMDCTTAEEAMAYVDRHHEAGRLFY